MSEALSLIPHRIFLILLRAVTLIEIAQLCAAICLEVCDIEFLSGREQEHAAQSDPKAMPVRRSHQRRSSAVRAVHVGIREETSEAVRTKFNTTCLPVSG